MYENQYRCYNINTTFLNQFPDGVVETLCCTAPNHTVNEHRIFTISCCFSSFTNYTHFIQLDLILLKGEGIL